MAIGAEIHENTSYHEDFEFAFKYNRWLLYSMAVWQDVKNPILKVCSRILNVVYIFIILGAFAVHWSTIYYKRNDTEGFFQAIMLQNVYVPLFIKYIIIKSNYKTIRACVRQMDSDWKYMYENSRKSMLEHAKTSRVFLILVTSIWLSTWLSYNISSWLQKPTIVDNVTLYALSYETYFEDFDARTAPYCFYFNALHFVFDGVMILTALNICLIITFVMHVCGQYKILESIVRAFGNDELSDRQLNIYIGRFLKKHVSQLR